MVFCVALFDWFSIYRFLIGPLFVIIAYVAWPNYSRATIVNGVDNGIAIFAHAILLVSF